MVGRNERRTEDLVRDHFKTDAYPRLTSEEQKSADPRITKCLAAASKHGSGIGKPEFLLHSPDAPGFLVVIECKADPAKHASTSLDQAKDFAVDGALHYAKHLSAAFDVIAIGVSGETLATMRVASFRRLKGASAAEDLRDENGLITTLLGFADYQRLRNFDPEVRKRTLGELMAFSRDLHNYMRAYAKVSEAEKPLLVSGILIALKDDSFGRTYRNYKAEVLPRELYAALERQVEDADLPHAKRQVMLQPYSFLTTHPELSKVQPNETESPLQHLVADIDEHVRPFISTYADIDVIGQFYGEFLRYAGGDKKGLGIVLTPRHVTEMFAKISNVGPDDTVLDTCSGTGGFLIAAMKEMDAKAGNDPAKMRRIRSQGLVGVEQNPTMFSLAASNMILRGDGKANLYQGSCFDPAITTAIATPSDRHPRPTVGLINPPYSQVGVGLHELDFIDHLLDCLTPGSLGVAIVPMSCAIDTKHPKRIEILRKHTLVAVMSMPDELFYPVGTVTCVMVFRAHQPHAFAPQSTWFGYWKRDGFIKTKDRGRIDLNHEWPTIRERWLDGFNNRREIAGLSVLHRVDAGDEWCAEAYMETDYSKITVGDFEAVVRNYALFLLTNGETIQEETDATDEAA